MVFVDFTPSNTTLIVADPALTAKTLLESSIFNLSLDELIENSKFEKFEVKGEGVIGEQPKIAPGEVYHYSSFTEISTPSGFMWGSYQMLTESEISFDVEIPKFELNMPRTLH